VTTRTEAAGYAEAWATRADQHATDYRNLSYEALVTDPSRAGYHAALRVQADAMALLWVRIAELLPAPGPGPVPDEQCATCRHPRQMHDANVYRSPCMTTYNVGASACDCMAYVEPGMVEAESASVGCPLIDAEEPVPMPDPRPGCGCVDRGLLDETVASPATQARRVPPRGGPGDPVPCPQGIEHSMFDLCGCDEDEDPVADDGSGFRCPYCTGPTTYQAMSGGREWFCPACETTGDYPADQTPVRAALLRTEDGRAELRRQMREHLAGLRKAGEQP
jgi:hypothetical protein